MKVSLPLCPQLANLGQSMAMTNPFLPPGQPRNDGLFLEYKVDATRCLPAGLVQCLEHSKYQMSIY